MEQQELPEYDFIIVGGGTAGCVLANRLSEDPDVSVLVLEAGEDRSDDSRVYTPALATETRDTPFDWKYVAEPSPELNGRSIHHPRGKIIGGSSAINSLAIIYPSSSDIDSWAELGNEGWDWKTLAPYYLKFQTIVPPSEDARKQVPIIHSDETIKKSNGPLQTAFPLRVTEFAKAWVDTFRTLGLENVRDPLGGDAIGGHTSTCHLTANHERSHAGVAYLDPVLGRKNLTVIENALAGKLTFEKASEEPIVRGLVYSQRGVLHEVRAKKEVILAAGTFNSPQILELSGIGDPKLLKHHNINIVHANPAVGENLQDHLRPPVLFEIADDAPEPFTQPLDKARELYEKNRTGDWAESGPFHFSYTPLQPFLDITEKQKLKTVLDKHLKQDKTWSTFERKRNAFIRNAIESPTEATAVTFLSPDLHYEPDGTIYAALFCMLSHPFSSGSSHITSPNPTTYPRIDFNYYSHPLDLEIHARHVQILQKLATTSPFASFIKSNGKRIPDNISLNTIEGAKEVAREFSWTNYHPCGTCSLGSVVNSKLHVKGVKKLRVVDASVFPIIPRGNIITTVYAVAERAADLISEEFGVRRST